MGACYQTIRIEAATEADLRKKYADYQRRLVGEHGTNPYNGTMSNCDLTVLPGAMTADDADILIIERCAKGEAMAVRLSDAAGRWFVGAWCPE
jgi:hypothetical protein